MLHIEGLRFMTQSPVKALFCVIDYDYMAECGIYDDYFHWVVSIQYPVIYMKAASLDGANAFKDFRKITLPLLMPSVTVVFYS